MPNSVEQPDPPLTSGDLRLRPFSDHDAASIVAAGNDLEIIRHTFMPEAPGEELAQQWLARAIDGWNQGIARFAIFDDRDPAQRCVGQVGLAISEYPTGNSEAMYWLLPEARGRSWASTALSLVANRGFSTLGIERISVLIDLDNAASQRVAEKAGFTREGVLRGYEQVPRRGRVDLWSFSLLATD